MNTPAAETLKPDAERYFQSIKGLKYPKVLTTSFARIANRIYELRDDRDGLSTYLSTLTHDHRGDRRGFPFDVLMELHAVQEAILGDLTGFAVDDENKWV